MRKKWIATIIATCISLVTISVFSACAGKQGPQGEAGKDGATPTIEISTDGYWVINGEKTEYKAVGQNGEDGREIQSVYYDKNGDLVIVYTDKTEQTVTLPVHTHVASDWIVDTKAACEEQGLQHKECTECNTFMEIALIPSKGGHDYEQGVCVACDDLQTKGLEYTLLSDDTYAVSGIGTCEEECIYIPKYYENKPVTVIGDNSFYRTNISSIILPDTIVTIESGAFYKCTTLKTVQLNNGLKTIEGGAFEDAGIKELFIPASVETLKTNTFDGCTSLKTVVFEDDSKLQNIYQFAFYGCIALESVVFGENSQIAYIGNSAFYGCSSLKEMEIPEGTKYVEYAAFAECSGLQSVKLPTTLKALGSHSFYNCKALREIVIPAATTSINHNAFTGCDSLIKLTVEQGNTVYHSSGNCIIETAAKKLVIGCTGSVLPQDDSVTEIGTWAFGNNARLKRIKISQYITKIEFMAFYNCGGLEEIIVDENNPVFHADGNCLINTAEKRILRLCSNSTIPSDGSVTIIQSGAFSGCAIQNLYIPACIELIVDNGNHIINLENIVVEEGNINYYSAGNCLIYTKSQTLYMGCKNSVIPLGVLTIASSAFESCAIETINIPISVKQIKGYAFYNCTALKEIRYEGTMEQWSLIEKDDAWDFNTSNYIVICSDGILWEKTV